MAAHQSLERISWMPHSIASGVKIKPLITQKEHGLDVTCMLVDIPAFL